MFAYVGPSSFSCSLSAPWSIPFRSVVCIFQFTSTPHILLNVSRGIIWSAVRLSFARVYGTLSESLPTRNGLKSTNTLDLRDHYSIFKVQIRCLDFKLFWTNIMFKFNILLGFYEYKLYTEINGNLYNWLLKHLVDSWKLVIIYVLTFDNIIWFWHLFLSPIMHWHCSLLLICPLAWIDYRKEEDKDFIALYWYKRTPDQNLNIFILSFTVVSCSLPVLPPRLSPMASQCNGGLSINYTESCSYSCDVGYNLVGSASVTCLANKSLSDFLPSCEGKNFLSIFQRMVDFCWRLQVLYDFLKDWCLEAFVGFMVKSNLTKVELLALIKKRMPTR